MKKLWEGIKEKIIVGLILSMLGIGGTFLWNTGNDLWNLPKIVKELKSLHTSDSLKAIKYIIKLDSVCKIVRDHELWLEDDYKNIQVLKTRTAPKTKITTNQPYRQQLKHNIK